MESDGILQSSASSVVEDFLQQNGKTICDIDIASKIAAEHSSRRNEAAMWLRKTVGVVAGRDLPAEPSEEGFRLGLRSGTILCNVLNKIQPGSISKVEIAPADSILLPDGAAYQYFGNVRNFLAKIEEMGLPTFEVSDFEKDGNTANIINCVLALKSYNERKLGKTGGNQKSPSSMKQKKNKDLFMNSISRTTSLNLDASELSTFDSSSFVMIVRGLLANRNEEEIPFIVENMLSKVTEEFEQRLANEKDQASKAMKELEQRLASQKDQASKAMEDYEQRMANQKEHVKIIYKDRSPTSYKPPPELTKPPPEPEAPTEPEPGEPDEPDEPSEPDQPDQPDEPDEAPEADEPPQSPESDRPHEAVEETSLPIVKEEYQGNDFIPKLHSLIEVQEREVKELKNIIHSTKSDMHDLQMKYREEISTLGTHLRTLAQASAKYQKVLAENRKLYNQVQDLKGNIRVYCRVRPFIPGRPITMSTVDSIEENNISIVTSAKYAKEGKKTFTFNSCFGPSATQEQVFADTQPLIRSVLDGFNVCIFAYGQTGAGKTYTMTGPNNLTEETVGVNFRALSDLFQISEQRKDTVTYTISVQMMEIYNETVRDLLVTDGSNKKLEIRNSSLNGINVPDANLIAVTSPEDVLNLMNLGHKNRAVSATTMNDRSSRSHSCLTVHVQGKDNTTGSIIRGSMHLVDLAGSERVDKSEVVGDRLKEAVHINKSLSALGDVIAALAQKQAHVPYRNSKLTQLLQDSLGGQAKTLMFVHISPELDAVGETLSTLKFAERVSTIELGAAKSNKDSGSEFKDLKEQISNLKAALARKEGEDGDGQEFILEAHPWPAIHETAGSGDWVDKVIVNKGNSLSRTNSEGKFEEKMLNHKNTPLDDIDDAASDSSEADIRSAIPRASSIPSGLGSKTRKPSPKSKTVESRNMPPTTSKSSGVSPLRKGVAKQSASGDPKRKPGSGK